MGYYAGDFYGGARGDPGFLGSLFGKVASFASSFIPGVGPIVSKGIDTLTTRAPMLSRAATAGASIVKAGKGVITKHPVLTAAGAAGTLAVGTGAVIAHHRAGAHPAVAGMRRRRRMNSCNPRALRRAIRRTHAFAKLAMKTIHLVHPKKKATFGGFKVRRKKR